MTWERTILDLGRSDAPSWDPRPLEVRAELRLVDTLNDPDRTLQTVEHEPVRAGDVPSIGITWEYGTARELERGNGSGGAGIDAAVLKGIRGPNRTAALRIHELAERWHLNTMRAGCAHVTPIWETGPYGRRTSLDLTPACPRTGYRYGHAWLVEVPPTDVVRELEELFRAPAWAPITPEGAARIRGTWVTR